MPMRGRMKRVAVMGAMVVLLAAVLLLWCLTAPRSERAEAGDLASAPRPAEDAASLARAVRQRQDRVDILPPPVDPSARELPPAPVLLPPELSNGPPRGRTPQIAGPRDVLTPPEQLGPPPVHVDPTVRGRSAPA